MFVCLLGISWFNFHYKLMEKIRKIVLKNGKSKLYALTFRWTRWSVIFFCYVCHTCILKFWVFGEFVLMADIWKIFIIYSLLIIDVLEFMSLGPLLLTFLEWTLSLFPIYTQMNYDTYPAHVHLQYVKYLNDDKAQYTSVFFLLLLILCLQSYAVTH